PAGKVIVALTGLAMAISVAGGPRWSLFGRAFQQVVRPAMHIRPATLEAAAPHRCAEAVGAVFLLAASVAVLLAVPVLGWAEVLPRLRAASAAHAVPLKVIDIKESPHLAAKYDVRLTPTTFVVGWGGKVQAGWLGTPPEGAVEQALAAVSAGVSV